MSRPKLTPWFHGSQVPRRRGVYERLYGMNGVLMVPVPLLDHWDGKQWHHMGELGRGGVCVNQHQPWRGCCARQRSKP